MMSGEIPSTALSSARLLHRTQVEPVHGPARGASVEEIEALERALGASLPAAYKEFLEWMGRDHLGVLCGTNCFVDQVAENQLVLAELLQDNGCDVRLPERYVCFWTHQGYMAAWFALPAAADPDCWIFAEGQTPALSTCGTFSEFLFEQLHALAVSQPAPQLQPPVARWLARIAKVVRPRR